MTAPNHETTLEHLAKLSRMLDAATHDVAVLDELAVRAKQEHEVASARAYLTAEGPVDARKAQAVVACADLALAADLAAARHRACRERIRTLGVQIDVGRSLSAAQRNQFNAEPVGQFT